MLALCRKRGIFRGAEFWPRNCSVIVVLLFASWFDYSFYEAWLTWPKWAEWHYDLAFFRGCLPRKFSGAYGTMSRARRVILALAFVRLRGVIVAALFLLHTGEVLMILLAMYFVLVTLLQRLAMDVVRVRHRARRSSGFRAILSAGFALAIFPLA